jgi:hypothetical protein
MDEKISNNELRFATVKNEATRVRWELFHRAIALAKESNAAAMAEAESARQDSSSDAEAVRQRAEPLLSIAR